LKYYPTVISDGVGGAIITWHDGQYYGSSNYDIYAQRVNSVASVLWNPNGVSICTASGNQLNPKIISDGIGGAIITWQDYRNSSNTTDIYAQRVDSNGTLLWSLDGIAICTTNNSQEVSSYPSGQIISDGIGGAIITWQDKRNDSSTTDIYVQRINNSGSVVWILNGVAICTASYIQNHAQLISDDKGGAIITWEDFRKNGISSDIYAQQINGDGSIPIELSRFEANVINESKDKQFER
jgi:hypothetical protein